MTFRRSLPRCVADSTSRLRLRATPSEYRGKQRHLRVQNIWPILRSLRPGARLGGDWVRTFTIITVPSNELIARIHDRMPAILRPADYERWLGSEPDPHDLLITFPSEPMKMWPISKRVNSPRNDDEDLLAEVDLAAAS